MGSREGREREALTTACVYSINWKEDLEKNLFKILYYEPGAMVQLVNPSPSSARISYGLLATLLSF